MMERPQPGEPGRPLFPLGRLLSTPGALAICEEAQVSPTTYLARHAAGDWGEVDAEDWAANDWSLTHEARLLSSYTLPTTSERLWIITEADRSATTLLRPEDY
jgi:hypothetical protein